MGEAEFFRIARNPASMLSYDGWNLDEESGVPTTVRYWSAPSKESLDIAIFWRCPCCLLCSASGGIDSCISLCAD
jgi:hypothetical protein